MLECDDRMLVSQRREARVDKFEDKHTCCQPSKTKTMTKTEAHKKTNTNTKRGTRVDKFKFEDIDACY